jgi:hypothetical protein
MSRLSFVAMLASVAFLAGCDKTFELSLTNTSSSGRDLEIKDPNGLHRLGMLEPGQRRIYTLKVDQDDLPAACTLNAGGMKKVFSLDKNARTDQNIYIEDGQIVGPLDRKMQVRTSTKQDLKNVKSEQHEVIRGDSPTPGQGGAAGGAGGGGVIIDQGEVVE